MRDESPGEIPKGDERAFADKIEAQTCRKEAHSRDFDQAFWFTRKGQIEDDGRDRDQAEQGRTAEKQQKCSAARAIGDEDAQRRDDRQPEIGEGRKRHENIAGMQLRGNVRKRLDLQQVLAIAGQDKLKLPGLDPASGNDEE